MYSLILQKYRDIIIKGENVVFTLDDLNLLADKDQLYLFIMTYGNNDKLFKVSSDAEQCIERIQNGDTLYRVLEYCILRNKVLEFLRPLVGM